jgi:signal-transduction protein with cAMP-binding, CBS, and nucleotidyltransferase domain
MGCDMSAPTTLLCDAEAALRAASGQSSVVRLKHEMRRLAIITARIRMGEIVLAHVPDTANAADIFTKWVSSVKFESMLAYLIGSRFCREGAAQVAHTMAALALSVERGESGGLRMLLGET